MTVYTPIKLSPSILLLSILCLATNLAGQQRFECNGETLISMSDGTSTTIFKPQYIPFSPPLLGIFAKYSGDFDALGFNPKDNYVYSVEQNTNTIVRHSLYNSVERIGTVGFVDTLHVNAGDCTAEGLYVCYDYKLHQMLVFDVENNLEFLRRIDLFWDPSSGNQGTFTSRIFDFAFDPNDTKIAYSYQGTEINPATTQGAMLKINLDFDNPNLGMVTPQKKLDVVAVKHIGGLTFDRNSTLYAFGSSENGLNPPQRDFFTINIFQGQTAPILSNNVGQNLSDACSCAFSLIFSNTVPFRDGMFCSNDTKPFILAFQNNSYIPLTDLVLKDTLPEGTEIKAISGMYNGKIDAGTGIGTNILSISQLEIPANERIEIELEVMSIDAKDGPAYNQAYLYNLPPHFPAILASDDPTSSTAGDRSNFVFITRSLENLSWKVLPPSDCLLANDGKIMVTAPDLLNGQQIEVSLRNTIGWAEYIRPVTVDNKHTFTVDSLQPGKYQLWRLRSLSDNCSVSLKDTLILLDAPNHLLSLQLGSNSPVCAGDSILFNNMMSPAGQMVWRGPNIFGSNELNPSIGNTEAKMSGLYNVKATYGFCVQKDTIEVEVKQQISSKIEGKSIYCVRDTLQLEVLTNDTSNVLKYHWLGVNKLEGTNSRLRILNIQQHQTGYYEAISTNGACSDTVGIDVLVQPTPSLALDKSIRTNFCEPLRLFPIVTDDTNVDYQWSPEEGLSCADCPNPLVIPIMQPSYQLKVENAYQCGDSASIQLNLDKGQILFAPNIFTPAAANNHEFSLFPNCAVHFIHNFDIYDRYGSLIFQTSAQSTTDILDSWDGFAQGKPVVPGVYVWVAKVELVDGRILYLEGDVARW